MMATIFEKKRGCSSYSGECFDKISSDNKDYLLPQFAYKYKLHQVGFFLRVSNQKGRKSGNEWNSMNLKHLGFEYEFL